MKKRLSTLFLAITALGSSTLASFGGGPANNSVQIFKGTIKSTFLKLNADSSQKGSYSILVYYIQSRTEGTEAVLGVNPKDKVFFIETSQAATFGLANSNKNLFNIRTSDLRDLLNGSGSLVGTVKPASYSGVNIDFHTPSLTYKFDSYVPAFGAPFLETHDKATLKIDKAMMKLAYDGGTTNVLTALNDVISFLASKGYVGLP